MDCLAVRERLGEYAVSTLDPSDTREVERHLEWCAGCRKEARELREGAAMIGLSLARSEPPPELEGRVLDRVRSTAARPHVRRVRGLRGATVLAAVLAFVAIGLAATLFARQQPLERRLTDSRAQAQHIASELRSLLRSFHGQASEHRSMSRALLSPPRGREGGGGALRVASPRFEDIAMVIIGGLPTDNGPYRAWLVGAGKRLLVGTFRLDSGGGGHAADEFTQDLRVYRSVEVRDAKGRLVLSGTFS